MSPQFFDNVMRPHFFSPFLKVLFKGLECQRGGERGREREAGKKESALERSAGLLGCNEWGGGC